MPFERKSALKNIILIPYVERKEEQLTKWFWLPMKKRTQVSDIAKRLMDYGYHAPTVSFLWLEHWWLNLLSLKM
jgi:glycine cleavage system protein P-like pyridoxal-binding family